MRNRLLIVAAAAAAVAAVPAGDRDTTFVSAAQALATKSTMTLPTAPTAEQQQTLKAVQEKAGTSGYDAAWLADQEAGHTKTLALIDTQIKTGGDKAVTGAAEKARPVVAMHLDMVRGGACHTM